MPERSVDMKADDAKIAILELDTPDEVLAFIDGEDRKTVLKIADERLKELGHDGLKDGQDTKITDDSKDFKGPGVEGKKDYVSGEDVLRQLRAKGVKI